MGEAVRKLRLVEDEKEQSADVIPIETGKKIRKKTEVTLKAGEMIKYLEEGNFFDAITIKWNIEDSIDITSVENYEEVVKECMRLAIEDKWEDREGGYKGFANHIIILKDEFGKNIDFRLVEGYEEVVKEVFFDYFKKGWDYDALDVKKNLGKGIDFSSIKGYSKAVKQAFLYRIDEAELKEAFKIADEFGEEVDLSKEIEKAFLILLKEGLPIEAIELENRLGYDMDLRSLKGYERAVRQGVRACLDADDENATVLMESSFGEGIVTPITKKPSTKGGSASGGKKKIRERKTA